ncbi:acireductone dioxygenase, partial [Xanthomonas perforans]|nr:acireductone dioxygenase [Xanthomonas perforans]
HLVAIRFLTEPDGWVGHFTGTEIAKQFPRYAPEKPHKAS